MNAMKESAVNKLKELVGERGIDFLFAEPYQTYKELLNSSSINHKIAGGILLVLASGSYSIIKGCEDQKALTKWVREECSFNQEMAENLTEIFCLLFSKENEALWEAKKFDGWNEFKKMEISFKWEGVSVWWTYTGSVDCFYNAEIRMRPVGNIRPDKDIVCILEENPFVKQELIRDHYIGKIKKYLEEQFEYYCTCEDYYQPVVEDFDMEDYINEWCKENSFELIWCEGEGYDGGYEPD